MDTFTVKTSKHEELIDITSEINNIVTNKGITSGICYVYTPHTTAAITINENADPTVKSDIIKGLTNLKLEDVSYKHMEGNSPSHIKSSMFGCSETIFIENSQLQLGTWQGIYFCEFDGPRSRKVMVKILSST